jgi:hypothetical protein
MNSAKTQIKTDLALRDVRRALELQNRSPEKKCMNVCLKFNQPRVPLFSS